MAKKTQTIACWSGGKDSTATILYCYEHNIPIDEIVFVEVMFDNENQISGEDPDVIKFVYETKSRLEEMGYKVTMLHAEKDYITYFHRELNPYRVTDASHVGKRKGFPLTRGCNIKRDCKIRPMEKYLKEQRKLYGELVQLVGICADEPQRYRALRENCRSVLYENGLTQKDAMMLCEKYGMVSPIYGISQKQRRGGCFFCPNAKIEEHRKLREEMPKVWKTLLELETLAETSDEYIGKRWGMYGETLWDRERVFLFEDSKKE